MEPIIDRLHYPTADLGALQAEQSLAGLPLMTALRKLGLTDQNLLGEEFSKPFAVTAAAEHYFPMLLTSGKTTHGDRPLLLTDLKTAITMRRAEARRRKAGRGIYRKPKPAKVRQVLATNRAQDALKAARRTPAQVAAAMGLPKAPPPPSVPLSLAAMHAQATRLVEQIEKLQARLRELV
jgi:hypothetical protein